MNKRPIDLVSSITMREWYATHAMMVVAKLGDWPQPEEIAYKAFLIADEMTKRSREDDDINSDEVRIDYKPGDVLFTMGVDRKTVFSVLRDGSIRLGENATLDEASSMFWDYVKRVATSNPLPVAGIAAVRAKIAELEPFDGVAEVFAVARLREVLAAMG